MRGRRGAAVALIAYAVLMALGSSPAAGATRCGARAAEVYARSSRAIVYGVQEGFGDEEGDPVPTVYACLYGSTPIQLGPLYLGSSGGYAPLRLFRLAGTWVAYVSEIYPMYSSPSFAVVVKRLTDGKTLVDRANGQIAPPPCCTAGDPTNGGIVGYGHTTDLVLSPDGAVGWIAAEAPLYPASSASAVITNFEGDVIYPSSSGGSTEMFTDELRVYGLDGRGERVFDTSTQISRGTLRLVGNQLSWLDDNSLQTATLGAAGRATPRQRPRVPEASLDPRCSLHVAGSHSVDRVYARDRQAIVFGVYYGAEDIPTVVGCVFNSGRIVKLGRLETGGEEPEQPGVNPYLVRLAGDVVAYPVEYHPIFGDPDSFRIVVKQLASGRTLLDEPNGTIAPTSCCNNDGTVGYGPTYSLIVTPEGAVAWIATEDVLYGDVAGGEQTTGEHQVDVHDRSGNRTLDTSTQVRTSSLRLSGNTIYWTDGTEGEHAPLG
jgi:hypothetical protein